MTYISYVEGFKGFHFIMEKNSIFVSTTATFNKTVYPHYMPKPRTCGFTPVKGCRTKSPPNDNSIIEDDSSIPEDDNDKPKQPHHPPHPSIEEAEVPAPPPPWTPTPPVPPPPMRQKPQWEHRQTQRPPGQEPSTRVPVIPQHPGSIYGESRCLSEIECDTQTEGPVWQRLIGQTLARVQRQPSGDGRHPFGAPAPPRAAAP
jgi:hypothetical protein